MEEKYCVYMHINKINNKKYIGISSNIKRRWEGNGSNYHNQVIGRAFLKYGWDNFEHKIIHTGLTKDEANKMEIEMISLYDSNNPNNGYNLTIGGTGSNGYSHTEEAKRKISKSQTGRIQTEECKKRISESLKGENSPWYRKTFTDEHRKNFLKLILDRFRLWECLERNILKKQKEECLR
jgi:group I intron endonuclease